MLLAKKQTSVNSLLEFLGWDTEFFGYKIGKIAAENGILPELLSESIIEAKKSGFEIVYLILPPDNRQLNDIARRFSAKLVDKKTTFFIKLAGDRVFPLHPSVAAYQSKKATKALLDLSLQIGNLSRFKQDKGFSPSEYERLYRTWMRRSVKRELAKEVFVYEEHDSIKGVVTLDINGDIGSIVLLGVDDKWRGQNIGFELVNASKRYFLKQNIGRLEVVTQGSNIPACNLYRKCGFDILDQKNVYHFWIR